MNWSMRTPRPDGMSEAAFGRLNRACEQGYRRVGKMKTKHGDVYVAVRENVENGVVDIHNVRALWACRDFAQENVVSRCSDHRLMDISVSLAEAFFDYKQ